jgi:hypothetical protein
METLGQLSTLSILGRDHLGEQAGAISHQSADRRNARLLDLGEGDAAGSQSRNDEGTQADRRPGF